MSLHDTATLEKLNRILLQFEYNTALPIDDIPALVRKIGPSNAALMLNAKYNAQIGIGPYIYYSPHANGFWNTARGFVDDKASATGYETRAVQFPNDPDMVVLAYADAPERVNGSCE